MDLIEALSSTRGAIYEPLSDPFTLGFRVANLPKTWSRTASEDTAGVPSVTWVNRSEIDDARKRHKEDARFVSTAVLIAWRIGGFGRSPAETAGLFCSMTEELTGWSSRGSENGRLDSTHASVRLLGTLDSPYGPLICNAHNIVYVAAPDELIAVQLSVTANPGDEVDSIRLCEGAAT